MLPIAFILGLVFGLQTLVDGSFVTQNLVFFSHFYFLLLSLTAVPIFFFTLIYAISTIAKNGVLVPVLLRTVATILTVMVSVAILTVIVFSSLANILTLDSANINNVIRQSDTVENAFPLSVDLEEEEETNTIQTFFLSIVPDNIYRSLILEHLVSIIFFAFLFGIVLSILRGNNIRLILDILHALSLSFHKIFHYLVRFLPIVLFGLTAAYVKSISWPIIKPLLLFLSAFSVVTIITVVVAFIIFIRTRKCSILHAFRLLFYPAIMGVASGNHLIGFPDAAHAFEKSEHREYEAGTITALGITFTLNNLGYFLFLNIFSYFSLLISNISITPLTVGVVFLLSSILSITGSINMRNNYQALESNVLFSSLISSLGVVGHLTSGFLVIVFQLTRPLQILYSVVINVFVSAIVFPVPQPTTDEPILDYAIDDDNTLGSDTLPGDTATVGQVRGSGVQEPELEAILSTSAEQLASTGKNMGNKAKHIFRIPFRLSVVVLTTILIIGYGLLSNVIMYSGSRVSLYSLADSYLSNLTNNAAERIQNYLTLPARVLYDIEVFTERKLDYYEDEHIVPLLRGILAKQQEFASIYYGDNNGRFSMAKRMSDGSISIRKVTNDGVRIRSTWIHENTAYTTSFLNSVDSVDAGYDPRKRIWYQAASTNKELTWSKVYVFASDNQLGITIASPIYDAKNELQGVFGVDIGLLEFSNFLNELDLGSNGHAFVIEKASKEFLAVSVPATRAQTDLYRLTNAGGQSTPERITVSTTLSPYYKRAYNAYENQDTIEKTSGVLFAFFRYLLGRADTRIHESENYNFSYEDDSYLVTIRDFSPTPAMQWQLGLVMSVDDFMGIVNQNNTVLLVFSFFLIVLIGFVCATVATRISTPIIHLATNMTAVRDLNIEQVSQNRTSRILEIQNMNTAFDSMLSGLQSFRKYVPADLVTQIIQTRGSASIGGERREVTLLFSDIRNFTTLSEQMQPEQLLEKLELYFDLFNTILLQTNATIDKYIGDAIMAFWGAPIQLKDHAIYACHAAVQFLRELRKQPYANIFYTRIGIHTGSPLVGNVGSSKRLNYTAIGDAVNTASRLENLNKYYGSCIIISEDTYKLVKDAFEVRYLDHVAVKGKKQGLKIYEIIGDKGTVDLLQVGKQDQQKTIFQFLSLYNLGVKYYHSREWGKAVHYFARAYQLRKHDKSAKVMYLRSYNFYSSPPPDDWNGIIAFHEK